MSKEDEWEDGDLPEGFNELEGNEKALKMTHRRNIKMVIYFDMIFK